MRGAAFCLAILLSTGFLRITFAGDVVSCGTELKSPEIVPKTATQIEKIYNKSTCQAQSQHPRTPKGELRGVWLSNVGSNAFESEKLLEGAMRGIKDLGLNTVYPVVWNKGLPLFSGRGREVFEKTFGSTPYKGSLQGKFTPGASTSPTPERDILNETITAAHKNGLKVIPWFEYGFKVHANGNRALTNENVKRGFFTRRRRNDPSESERKLATQMIQGFELAYLNPFHKEAQKIIRELILDVVKYEGIDGIQFDDHFSLPVELGYDDYTVGRYKSDYLSRCAGKLPRKKCLDQFASLYPGGQDFPPPPPPEISGLSCKPKESAEDCSARKRERCLSYDKQLKAWQDKWSNPKRSALRGEWSKWVNWRADQFSSFVKGLAASIRSVNPKLKIVVAPNYYNHSRSTRLQDWKRWVKDGSVDELIIQVYQKDFSEFQKEFIRPEIPEMMRCVPVSVALLPTPRDDQPISLTESCSDGLRPQHTKLLPATSKLLTYVRSVGEDNPRQQLAGFAFFDWQKLQNVILGQKRIEAQLRKKLEEQIRVSEQIRQQIDGGNKDPRLQLQLAEQQKKVESAQKQLKDHQRIMLDQKIATKADKS
jgi:uncharacterized lipoprotein YddW (UPF0748 family)